MMLTSAITTSGGAVDIDVQDDVRLAAAGDITTTGGTVDVTADFDGDGNGLITMTDGAVVNAGDGFITLEADEDVTLGSLITTTDVNITTRSGGVIDGGDENTAATGVADIVADTATIISKEGVGDANALELEVNNIEVNNSNVILADPASPATGDINLIQEAAGDDINVLNLDNDALNGDVTLTAEDGTITVLEAGQSGLGIEAVNGTVALDAQGTGSDVIVDNTITTVGGLVDVDAVDDVEVNAAITTSGGAVDIDVQDDVRFAAEGDIFTSGGNVDVTADFDTDGNGAITMTDGTVVNSGAGTITFEADQDITLGGLRSTGNVNVASRGGAIVDGGDVNTDVSANVATLSAANGIGDLLVPPSGDEALELQVNVIDAQNSTSGNINLIEETGANSDISVLNLKNMATNGDISLIAEAGSIDDDTGLGNSSITTIGDGGDAVFNAANNITLVNAAGDEIIIGGNASFTAVNTITIGQDGSLAAVGGDAADNTQFGTLTVNSTTATITEDDGTLFAGTSRIEEELFIESGGDITNQSNANLTVISTDAIVGRSQFVATDNNVFLGNVNGDLATGDVINLSNVGVVADNAFFGLNGDVELISSLSSFSAVAPNPSMSVFGTDVDETLFVRAAGAVTSRQTNGLDAFALGINADDHVHLNSIAATNTNLAIVAGSNATVVDATAANQLMSLSDTTGIRGTEVQILPQAISFVHEGDLNIGEVTTSALAAANSISGFESSNGSIFISAADSITIAQNIEANGGTSEAQVTVYLENPSADAIEFLTLPPSETVLPGTLASITATGGGNRGVVSQAQTFADVIDPTDDTDFGDGTNGIIQRNDDGSSDQSFEVAFGIDGEEGFRVGFIFDAASIADTNNDGQISDAEALELLQRLNDPDLLIDNPDLFVQNPNLFVPDVDPVSGVPLTSEEFEFFIDTIADIDETSGFVDRGVLEVQSTDRTSTAIFAKDAPFTSDEVVIRSSPFTLTTVIVRNDQNINLFAGNLDTVTNELNEFIETVEAQFAGVGVNTNTLFVTPEINQVAVDAPVEVVLDAPQFFAVTEIEIPTNVVEPDTNELFFVQVEVNSGDVEEVDGELQLTDPSGELEALEDADETEINDGLEDAEEEIDANDVEAIIERIEEDPEVEAGYWYKVLPKNGWPNSIAVLSPEDGRDFRSGSITHG